MVTYIVGMLVWMLNAFFGNNGEFIHSLWLKTTWVSIIRPIVTLILAY